LAELASVLRSEAGAPVEGMLLALERRAA